MSEQVKVNGKLLSPEESARWIAAKRRKNRNMFKELAAEGRGIGVNGTDSAFLQGDYNGNQFERCPAVGDMTKKYRPGYSPGAKYISGAKRWVSSRGELKRICERENLNCEGAVTHEARPVPPPPSKRLSEKTIRDHLVKAYLKDPGLVDTKAKRKRLREDVINKHGPQR